jgi:hypothetical protein
VKKSKYINGLDDYYLLWYKAMYSIESKPMFRRNILPPPSGSEDKLSKKPACKQVASRAVLVSCSVILWPWRWRQYVAPKC